LKPTGVFFWVIILLLQPFKEMILTLIILEKKYGKLGKYQI